MMEHDSEEAPSQARSPPLPVVLEISSESEAICQLKNWMGDNIFNMATVSFSDLYPWQEEALRLSLLSKTLLICVPYLLGVGNQWFAPFYQKHTNYTCT